MARGLVYVAAYLGFVLPVPILVLGAAIMAPVLRALRLLARQEGAEPLILPPARESPRKRI